MSLRLIRERFRPNALLVDALSRITPVVADRLGMKLTLGWLVHHAMSCGTTKLRVGVNQESGESWMKFFGPRWYRQPIWWDMVPPEAYCYPTMLQVCLSLAELDQGLPIKGMIPAIKQGKRLRLELTVDTIDSFQIAWDQEFALDRQEAKTSYPEEEQTGNLSVEDADGDMSTNEA